MNKDNLWLLAKEAKLNVSSEIMPGFDIGFDERIPSETCDKLRAFVKWVEENFNIPITLWVDFEFKNYLISREKKRVGYLFYWADFLTYPIFENKKDIPAIRLPVKEGMYDFEEILTSFIEAITEYFAWVTNALTDDFVPNENDVNEIFDEYMKTVK